MKNSASAGISAEDYLRNRSRMQDESAIDEDDEEEEKTPMLKRKIMGNPPAEGDGARKKRQVEERKEEAESEYGEEYESEDEDSVAVREPSKILEKSDRQGEKESDSPLIDYFYAIESGHKDFVRSMI